MSTKDVHTAPETAFVQLWRRDVVVATALIDVGDLPIAAPYRWGIGGGYAIRSSSKDGRSRRVALHREIMGLSPGDGLEVDHINRDKLDNRRVNLRVVTHRENAQNVAGGHGSSRHRGVAFHKHIRLWQAQVGLDGKSHYLGMYATEEEAARVASAFRAEHMPCAVEPKVTLGASTDHRLHRTAVLGKQTMLSTRVSVDLMRALDERAATDGEPRSDLVRRALELYIDNDKETRA